ncbi:MAG: hypothetical protein AB1411_12250 [Nitrospirota bacterium]
MRSRVLSFLVVMCLAVGPSATGAGLSDAVETVGPGTVNWTSGVVTATGLGAPPESAVNRAQARAMAERAAYSVAVRNLLEAVKGIQVDSISLVENYMVKSEAVRTRVSGLVKGAQKIKTEHQPDGGVEVTVGISLSGELLDAVIPKEFGRRGTTAVPAPQAPVAPRPAPPASSSTPPPAPAAVPPAAQPEPAPSTGTGQAPPGETYTGLLVDARGLGLKPALAPRLLDEQGKELYAGEALARDQAVQAGVAGYAKDMIAGSRQQRVTDKPLIVKGVRASGNKATDIVLDGEGVKAIQQSEPSAHYLRQARVVVVYD